MSPPPHPIEPKPKFDVSGFRRGSTVLLHSNFTRTYRQRRYRPAEFIADILAQLGPDGTLLLPLFNFDFTRGVPFDIRSTPSQMGALTEAGRQWPGATRTGHPIYSFAAIGAQAELFAKVDNMSGYGADSPFAILRELGGDIAVLDLPDQHSMTFYHHVEEMLAVDYRFHKNFTGDYTDRSGQSSRKTYSIFVRDLDRGVKTSVDRMGELLWARSLYRGERPKTGTGLRFIAARPLFDTVAEIINAGLAKDYLYELD